MKKNLLFFLWVLLSASVYAQTATIKGVVADTQGKVPLVGVEVSVDGTTFSVLTDGNGAFSIETPVGDVMLTVIAEGYLLNSIPVEVPAEGLDLGMIFLEKDVTQEQTNNLVALTEANLTDEGNGADITSGLLQSSRDTYLNAAAFDFSPSFFRVRGLNTDNSKVLINGIEMNKIYDGRPLWTNWGGLNDVTRDQEFSNGLAPSDYSFGSLIGTTNINMRASKYRPGVRVAYSNSNRSYANRAMATYSTGLMENGWAFTVAATRRWGEEGFNEATSYNANSLFASVEYKFNEHHSLNAVAIYAANRRGKSSPNTQEVFDLKGTDYNEYWGYQNGDKRNSRIKDVSEPIMMLNHFWTISNNSSLQTNVSYQFGHIGNSRLDYNGSRLLADGTTAVGGGSNPSPTYYQKLPSFWLGLDEGPNYTNAYLYEQEFINNGQIDWASLYQHNIENTGGYSTYVLYEDRTEDGLFNANTIFKSYVSDNIILNASLNYKKLTSDNFAKVIDLLGGNGYLDIDSYANNLAQEGQNDLNNPNRVVGEGDTFKYNYRINSDTYGGFVQAQFKYNKVDFYVAGDLSQTTYQRDGLYRNGAFPNSSYGKGEKLEFTGYGAKAGLTYKITGRHLLDFNGAFMNRAPNIRNTYSNSRENNNVVNGIKEEVVTAFDASYILRLPNVKARLTGYYNTIEDASEISFYYAEGVSVLGSAQNDPNAFVQEVLTNIDKRNMGMELGIEAQVTPTIKLKGAASIMESVYKNNPDLYLTDDTYNEDETFIPDASQIYTSYLKDYKVATGPQRAYQVGFEYRDPDYWWFGATANFFSHAYIDVAPLTRTSNFYTNPDDGQVFNDYDENVAKDLLKQERFNDYMTINLTGGKSWRINYKYYIGVFASINNLLDEKYKTGGFEQGRNATYRGLQEDKSRPSPVFGSKYWYGYGTTYFLNVYFRF